MDASNLLKPALQAARLRCIGATTWEEFRQTFQRDQALARRFQKVEVDEPTVEETVKILAGPPGAATRSTTACATPSRRSRGAAELADRYLRDRRLPDKAIDLLDEAGRGACRSAAARSGWRVARRRGRWSRPWRRSRRGSVKGDEREQLQRPGGRAQGGRLRPGRGDRAAGRGDQGGARRPARRRRSRSAPSSSPAPPASARPRSRSSSPRCWASPSCAST